MSDPTPDGSGEAPPEDRPAVAPGEGADANSVGVARDEDPAGSKSTEETARRESPLPTQNIPSGGDDALGREPAGIEAAPQPGKNDPAALVPDAVVGEKTEGVAGAGPAPALPPQKQSVGIVEGNQQIQNPAEKFVFKRQLDQAYLIIDHISMSQVKTLPGCSGNLNPSSAPPSNFIEDIYRIHYPPTGDRQEKSAEAKTLVCALDELNRAAWPANGKTIAFTIMVSGEDDAGDMFGGVFSSIAKLFGRKPKVARTDDTMSRISLAREAFPNLIRPASRFRAFNFWLIVFLTFWLIFTCGLSWNVASGNTLLAQVTTFLSARDAVGKQIASSGADGSTNAPPANTGPAPSTNPQSGATTTDERLIGPHCTKAIGTNTFYMVNAKQAQPVDTATGLPLCQRRGEIAVQLASARQNLRGWLRDWHPMQPKSAMQPKSVINPGVDSSESLASPDEIDAQWAAALMNVLAGTVLPICYGVLGAGAAVVRNVSARIRDSLLAPRDLMLGLIQLVLGAVIGVTIGLFVTPAGDGGQGAAGLLGSVHLTASALCFVAGFGVEQVFVALERLIKRVFDTSEATPQPAAPAR